MNTTTKMIEYDVLDFETEAIDGPVPFAPPKPVSVSILQHGHKLPQFFSWGHPSGNNCDWAEGKRIVGNFVKRRMPIVFHNAPFDIAVMLKWFGCQPPPQLVHDTMLLAYLYDPLFSTLSLKPLAAHLLNMPPEEQDKLKDWILANVKGATVKNFGAFICKAPAEIVCPYANGDVLRTAKLFEVLYRDIEIRGMYAAYRREIALQPVLHGMTKEGVRIDRDRLINDYVTTMNKLEITDGAIRVALNCADLNIDSNEQLADALDKADAVKHWGMTEHGKRKTSRDALLSGLKDPALARTLAYRGQLATITGTFMGPWIDQSHGDNRLHPNWNAIRGADWGGGTRTGRLSSSNPNFQNIPGDLPEMMEPIPNMRSYVLPDEGEVFISADFHSQEVRILGHYTEGGIKAIYDKDPFADVHEEVQKLVRMRTGKDYSRKVIKALVFSMIYGAGATSTAMRLKIPVMETQQLMEAILDALPGTRSFIRELREAGDAGEIITTWGGRKIQAPMGDNGRRKGYALINYLIQGGAADQTKTAMINYHTHHHEGRLLASVHDEICISAPKHCWKLEAQNLVECMTSPKFDLPMRAAVKTGPNWGDLQDIKPEEFML